VEEFERMLAAVRKVRSHDARDWKRYLTGLWLSGLRLEESLILSWDEEAPFSVDLSGKHPRFRILGEAQKSGRDELLPMTPDFAEFLLATSKRKRHGPVFPLLTHRGKVPFVDRQVGRVVSRIGEKAGVVVSKAEGKFASAHDLRRAFGTRWARRVMPAVLQRLMRHASIQTTMGYYVDLDADELAAELWSKHPTTGVGNTFGNNGPTDVEKGIRLPAASPCPD
jgi:integrase